MAEIKRFNGGLLGSNTYLIWDETSGEACVIDTGNPAAPVAAFVRKNGLRVQYIVLTHAHYDHILYIDEFKAAFPEATVCIHAADDPLMEDPRLNGSLLFGSEHRFPRGERLLNEGDVLTLGETRLEVLSTPGHTEGSICLKAGGVLFSGDTLFYDSFGRTDLGAGDMDEMGCSLDRLFALPEDTRVLPGHGTATTIGREKRENPFLYIRW